jgi:hypothetical protein
MFLKTRRGRPHVYVGAPWWGVKGGVSTLANQVMSQVEMCVPSWNNKYPKLKSKCLKLKIKCPKSEYKCPKFKTKGTKFK